ncbi:restriction endonuclease subunit S [Dorea longicatena]|uniref:restriction endonuclease subunit S n=1 Tax=Dorea longicatena TaxID=88431 RepID=UPI001FF54647|nr:restriction endonuclease subunit S [Dorea longicatena]UOX53369.1 restriction endonuclease subunit S [Dorea longicatena]
MKYKLKEIFDLHMGKTPSRNNAEYWNSNEYKWISIADLSKTGKYIRDTKEHLSKQAIDESGIKLIPANTVIMSFKLSIGKTAITAEDMYSNEAIMAFHDKHVVDILPEYLFYMFKFKNWDEGSNKAVMGKTLNKATLSDVEIDVCSIEKQREIVDILNKIMNILENRDNEIVLLDNLIKARFVEMFVKNEYDWKEVTIAEVCIDMRTGPFGSSLHHDEFVDKGVFVLGIDNAVENTFSYNRMRYITEEKYEKLKRYTVYPGDVIITIMGTVGKAAVIPKNMPKAINTKHLACLTPNTEIVDSYFLVNAFQIHPLIRHQLESQCKGAIMDGLNLTIIKGLKFKLPPIKLQRKFVEFYNQVNKSKVAVQRALDETQILFDSLMQKYFG